VRDWLSTVAPFLVGFVVVAVRYSALTVGATFTFGFCYIALKFWHHTLHKAFLWLAGISIVRQHPFGALRQADAAVEEWLDRGMAWSEGALVYALNQLVDTFAIFVALPILLAQAIAQLSKVVGTQLKHAVTTVEVHRITNTIVKPVKTTVRVVVQRTRIVETRVIVAKTQIVHVGKAVTVALAKPGPRLKRIERTITGQGKRLKTVERRIALPAFVALLIAGLAKIGASYITCRNNKRLGREVCNMDPSLLSSFLLDVALLAFAFNIRTFTRELESITGEVGGLIKHLTCDSAEEEATAAQAGRAIVPR
jgi:hypothetical protein